MIGMADERKPPDAAVEQVKGGELAHQEIVRADAGNLLVGHDPADADPRPLERTCHRRDRAPEQPTDEPIDIQLAQRPDSPRVGDHRDQHPVRHRLRILLDPSQHAPAVTGVIVKDQTDMHMFESWCTAPASLSQNRKRFSQYRMDSQGWLHRH